MSAPDLVHQVTKWRDERPPPGDSLPQDAERLMEWHGRSNDLLSSLASEDASTTTARQHYRAAIRAAHAPVLARHHEAIAALARSAGPRELDRVIAATFPVFVPSAKELAEDGRRRLAHKIGFEYKSALVYAELLGAPASGHQLVENARRETARAVEELPALRERNELDLGRARIRVEGSSAFIEITNPEALNAEDDAVLDALEACVDLALLDDRVGVVVLRGGEVRTRKHTARRFFCSGINLTELHEGRLSYDYFVRRELGLVSKIFRGLSAGPERPEIEKPVVGVVDGHAIGGGLQLLLVMDYVLADEKVWMSLPARKEGIIPGVSNLRLAHFIGERAARRAILLDAPIAIDSPEGRALVDEVVPAERLDEALAALVAKLGSTGLVSFAANRKALRIGREPLEAFREYMAHFALAQADCHFSPALADNLDRYWMSRKQSASDP